jgi:hypothetical protein
MSSLKRALLLNGRELNRWLEDHHFPNIPQITKQEGTP